MLEMLGILVMFGMLIRTFPGHVTEDFLFPKL